MPCHQVPNSHIAAISFGVHNGMSYLSKNLKVVESITGWFVDYRIFYLENDSTDGTIPFLQSWKTTRKVHGWHTSFTTSSHQLCVKSYNCPTRFRFLANLRNMVWKWIQTWNAWTVWISIDIDFVQLNLSTLKQSIEIANALDAAAMFSTSVFRGKSGRQYLYEAYHFKEDRRNKTNNGCPVRVRSAFGGVAMYFSKIRNIPNLSYNTRTVTYEHIDFNKQIDRFGYRLYINRRMNPLYKWGQIR
jgi:hypothetical protein